MWRERTPSIAEDRRALLLVLAEAREAPLCDSAPHAITERVAVRTVLTVLNDYVIRRPWDSTRDPASRSGQELGGAHSWYGI